MGHIKDQMNKLGLTHKRIRKPQPFDRYTKAQLWRMYQANEKRLDKIGKLANALGRDLRREHTIDSSDRAYKIRDTARKTDS